MAKHFTEEQNKAWLASLPRKAVAAKVIIKSARGYILLVKPTYKAVWQFPGGSVERSEDPTEAAARELAEELDLRINPTNLRIVGSVFRKEHDILILIYEYTIELDEMTNFQLQHDEIEDSKFDHPAKVLPQISDYYVHFWKGYYRGAPLS